MSGPGLDYDIWDFEVRDGSSEDTEVQVLRTQLGDGYEQITDASPNPIKRSWPLVLRKPHHIADQAIEFLETHRGRPFAFAHPRSGLLYSVRCLRWRRVKQGAQTLVTMTFEEAR